VKHAIALANGTVALELALERLPVAQELGGTSLMFLVHPTLSEKDMVTVADIAEEVFAVNIKVDFKIGDVYTKSID
jgi:dTDP-4-amino-4,6-dideoxygalactose transaminase